MECLQLFIFIFKGHYEFEKVDILRQYHEENARFKAQLQDEKKKRKQLEDEIENLKRRLGAGGGGSGAGGTGGTGGGNGGNGGRGDINVVLDDDHRRREHLEEENKKLLYQMNKLLSKKDDVDGDRGDVGRGGSSSDSSDDITRIRRKLAVAEEDRDKFERMKKDLEYEMDRNKSKFENLQGEVER